VGAEIPAKDPAIAAVASHDTNKSVQATFMMCCLPLKDCGRNGSPARQAGQAVTPLWLS
jgi:hypothetical protein